MPNFMHTQTMKTTTYTVQKKVMYDKHIHSARYVLGFASAMGFLQSNSVHSTKVLHMRLTQSQTINRSPGVYHVSSTASAKRSHTHVKLKEPVVHNYLSLVDYGTTKITSIY